MIYLVGTFALWIGLGCLVVALRGAVLQKWKSVLGGLAGFGIGLLLHGTLPMTPDARVPAAEGWRLPVVWLMVNVWGWLALVCLVGFGVRMAQGLATSLYRRSLGWLVGLLVFGLLFWKSGDEIEVLKGAITQRPMVWLGLALAVLAGALLSSWAQKKPTVRPWLSGLGKHTALVAGSIIFSIPLFWLLLTSFREDRDTSFEKGLRLIPRVMVLAPYENPKKPYVEATYQSTRVQGFIDLAKPQQMVIDRPIGMRGLTIDISGQETKTIPQQVPVVVVLYEGEKATGKVIEFRQDGLQDVLISSPTKFAGKVLRVSPAEVEPVWRNGPKWSNYREATEYLPPETQGGLVYLRNSFFLVVMSVLGTLLSCSVVAYGFSRLQFFGKNFWYGILLATMMLPGAVTLLPGFLIYRELGWIDTLYPLWVPSFFAGAFNVFLLRQFFSGIPLELEDAAKIDGCSFFQSYWRIMMPQIKPALTVVAIWTFMGTWNNFMGPLIYVNSPEKMTVAYALQLFLSDHSGEPTLMMAFATMAMIPVLVVFFAAQKYFIEGVTLSGLGGR